MYRGVSTKRMSYVLTWALYCCDTRERHFMFFEIVKRPQLEKNIIFSLAFIPFHR